MPPLWSCTINCQVIAPRHYPRYLPQGRSEIPHMLTFEGAKDITKASRLVNTLFPQVLKQLPRMSSQSKQKHDSQVVVAWNCTWRMQSTTISGENTFKNNLEILESKIRHIGSRIVTILTSFEVPYMHKKMLPHLLPSFNDMEVNQMHMYRFYLPFANIHKLQDFLGTVAHA